MSSKKFIGYVFSNKELFNQALIYLHDNNPEPRKIVSLDWEPMVMSDGQLGLIWPEDISDDGLYVSVMESEYGPPNEYMSDTDFVVLPEVHTQPY